MLLQKLNEYADRLKLPPQLYSETPIRYIIELDGTGRLTNASPTDTANPAESSARRGVRRLAPQVTRAVAIKPLLLADKSDYTFGLIGEDSKPKRVAECHAAYMDLLARCAQTTRERAVGAVLAFLRRDPIAELSLPADFDAGALVTFRVEDTFPIDLPTVQVFWAAEHDPAGSDRDPVVMQCLVCGRDLPVLNRLQGKIKGVPGGQTAGTSIISANADAFESYGLENSLIAPTCASCGERFTKAANDLIRDPHTHITIGGSIFLFWTRDFVPSFSWGGFLTDPQPEQVHALLSSAMTGKRSDDLDNTAFYATALSGSGGRAVVRDWIDMTVAEAQRNLATWFARQRIVDDYGVEGKPLSLYRLAGATARELRDVTGQTTQALIRSALTGGSLPMELAYQAIRRNRAEQKITYPRATLIKLVLTSRQGGEEDSMVELNKDNPSQAYRCGRLFAVLEEAQKLAVPGIKATIVDRFFGSASSAPMAVFGRLLAGVQPHLTKLERDRPATAHALQARIEEIMGGLHGFPRVLPLEDQAMFSLGYYHQRAYDRAQAREASARKKAGAIVTADAAALADLASDGD